MLLQWPQGRGDWKEKIFRAQKFRLKLFSCPGKSLFLFVIFNSLSSEDEGGGTYFLKGFLLVIKTGKWPIFLRAHT